MGPLSSTHKTSTAAVTTVGTRLYGLVIGVSGASATNSLILSDGGAPSGSNPTLLTIDIGHSALGPVTVMMPAESYIRFDTSMYATLGGSVDSVTFLYQM